MPRKSWFEGEIQFEHIDPRLAKNIQAAADQMLLDQPFKQHSLDRPHKLDAPCSWHHHHFF